MAMVGHTKLFTLGESLDGVESLVGPKLTLNVCKPHRGVTRRYISGRVCRSGADLVLPSHIERGFTMHDAGAIDALTAQVNELARVCARLSEENAELRGQVSALSVRQPLAAAPTSPTAAAEPERLKEMAERGVSRRAVGVALAGAAAGVIGAAVLTDRGAHPAASSAGTSAAVEENAHVELAAVEETAAVAPTNTRSIVSGALPTTSGVLSGTNTSTGPGVSGTNTGAGAGIEALNQGGGPAITGSSMSGRGGVFTGSAAAQIQLVPGAGSHPKSGERGDLYADASGRLWFCKTSGKTATWHQIA